MQPRIQYAKTSDGVNIAYWTLGQGGEPLLIMSPLAASHIALEWRFPAVRAWYEHLARSRMIVRYDSRSSGMSQRGVADISPGARLLDIDAVADSLGLERFGVIAAYAAGRFGIAYAADHPERVSKLATWCEGMPSAKARQLTSPAMLSLGEEDWQAYIETFSHRLFGWSKGKDAHEWASLWRESTNREDFLRSLMSIFGFDFRDRLADVRSPTLVLHHSGYMAVEPSQATDLAAGIPGAQLVMIPGRFEPLYECAAAMDAIDEFFGITPQAAVSSGADLPSGTAIILFADIVDSTALTERLGDDAFREKARGLDEAMRAAIRENGGSPVEGKTLGDGVLAVFTSAKQAIACAQACHESAIAAGLSLHAGIHAGDVIREADPDGRGNVYGGAVNIAARVASEAAAGETLLSGTVRDLARTSAGVTFEDRGERELKGVGEPVRVWAVKRSEGE
jgi:class 3 adenylate cyclase/pimeloyl-ACP methyl ester carboxylesterase